MNDRDHAIVVGIDTYPGISSLKGAQGDANAFADWLADPVGGAVPGTNIHRVLTSQYHPPPAPNPAEADPNAQRFSAEIQALLADDSGQLRPFPVGRRLYLFFSGHGFLGSSVWAEAALYAANATFMTPEHIPGTRIANTVKAAAAFEEIVLVMDCCRDVSLTGRITDPLLVLPHDSARAATVRTFCAYAVPPGGKARERQIVLGGPVQGVFTYALLEALRRTPADANGDVTGQAVKNYIHNRWPTIAAGTGPPSIEVDSANDLTLVRRPAPGAAAVPGSQVATDSPTEVCITVDAPVPTGSEVVLLGGLPPQEITRLPIVAGVATCLLAPGIYKMHLDGTNRKKLFEVIGVRTDERL